MKGKIIAFAVSLFLSTSSFYGVIFTDDFESGTLDQWTIGGRQEGRESIAEVVTRYDSQMAYIYQDGFSEISISKILDYNSKLDISFDMEAVTFSDDPDPDSIFFATAGGGIFFLDSSYNELGSVRYVSATSSTPFNNVADLPNVTKIQIDNEFNHYSLNIEDLLSYITIDSSDLTYVKILFGSYATDNVYNMSGYTWVDNVVITTNPYTYHVDGKTGSNSNNGLSRETAFETIQYAINIAEDYDTILVWPGVYNETTTHGIYFMGKAITVKGAPDADAPVLEVPGFTAVSFYLGEDENSILSNFVIRGSSTGIFTLFANPTIDHVTVVNNNNGVIADNASPIITNSIFWDNLNGDLYDCTAQNSFVEDEVGLDDGLVAYWAFDEGSGSTAYDSVGGNNGTLINGPVWTEGKVGGALKFDGGNDYVSCGDILDGEISNAFTIGVWMKLDAGALLRADEHTILWKNDDRPGLAVRSDSRVAFRHWYYQKTTAHAFQSTQLLEEEQWYYLTYVFDGSNFIGYVNAEHSGSVQDSGYSPGGGLNIGSDYNGVRSFKGIIDDIRIYNRALSVEEIEALYETGLVGYGSPKPLFADPNNGDYHLLSERGRYRPSTDEWILDNVTSPCVDAGNPNTAPTTERMPNGGRINMGAYGNTATASMSEWSLEGDFNRDGIINLSDFAIFVESWLQKEEWKN